MEKYVLEALFMMDGATQAVHRMKRRYRPQVESWTSTLWEDWEWQPWNSYNHAWAGGPLTLLSRYAAGVAPAAPGYEEYALVPRMGPLRRVDAAVPTPRGTIELRMERDTTHFRIVVNAPMDGTVDISASDQVRLRANGVEIWAEGDSSGVRVLALDAGRARLSVPAGGWTLEAEGVSQPLPPADEVFNLSENPIRSGRVVFNFRERPSVAAVFTLDGRRVVDLVPRLTRPDLVTWDLTNDRGSRVAAGIYLFVAKIGPEVVRRRLIVPHDG